MYDYCYTYKYNMRKFVAIFPGQGSQFVGMNKSIYDEYKIVRDTIQEAEDVTGIKLKDMCLNGPLSALSKPENAHVAILAFGVAAFRVFVSETGCLPEFCAGHSLGEYTALVCAGVIKFSDALKLVQLRSKLSVEIQNETDGGMTIIDGIESSVVESVCREQQEKGKRVYVSCYNSKTQTAISGYSPDVMEAEGLIRDKSGIITPLFGSSPFHCPLMESGKEKLNNIMADMEFSQARYPVMSNYLGRPYESVAEVRGGLLQHLTNPVKWTTIIEYFYHKGIDSVIDFSPKNIFDNMLSEYDGFTTFCFGIRSERENLLDTLNNEEYAKHKTNLVSKALLAVVSTPNLNFNEDEYKSGVVEKYNKIVEINNSVETEKSELTNEVKKEVFNLLTSILETKKVDISEIMWWKNKILEETASVYEV